MSAVSVVIPACNEADGILQTIKRVHHAFLGTLHDFEIIVVDDGSTDETAQRAYEAGATVIHHPYNIGYGNALLTGIRQARHELVAITDADGTYPVEELPSMVTELQDRKLDMLVGARRGKQYVGSLSKRLGRFCFKHWAEFTTGRNIPDINSGLRVMRRDMVMRFASVLCGGFSFTTTITVIAILSNCFVGYRGIEYGKRIGKSHVRYLRDTLRTAQILVMSILLFNPIKLYLPYSLLVLLTGIPAVLGSLLFPGFQLTILTGGMFFLGAALLMGLGFLCEQRRSSAVFAAADSGTPLPRHFLIRSTERGTVAAFAQGTAAGMPAAQVNADKRRFGLVALPEPADDGTAVQGAPTESEVSQSQLQDRAVLPLNPQSEKPPTAKYGT